MNYTEATRLSRQMSGGMTKTALEGWQRAGLGATGGGLLAYTMASLINPSMSRRGKILSTLAGMGTGAAAGYRFLPGYGSSKATTGTGNAGNAGNATTDASTSTTQAQVPAQTAAKTPAKTQTKAPVQTQAPAPAKAPVKTPAQTATQTPAQGVAPAESLGSLGATQAVEPAPAATPAQQPQPTPVPQPAPTSAQQPDAPHSIEYSLEDSFRNRERARQTWYEAYKARADAADAAADLSDSRFLSVLSALGVGVSTATGFGIRDIYREIRRSKDRDALYRSYKELDDYIQRARTGEHGVSTDVEHLDRLKKDAWAQWNRMTGLNAQYTKADRRLAEWYTKDAIPTAMREHASGKPEFTFSRTPPDMEAPRSRRPGRSRRGTIGRGLSVLSSILVGTLGKR